MLPDIHYGNWFAIDWDEGVEFFPEGIISAKGLRGIPQIIAMRLTEITGSEVHPEDVKLIHGYGARMTSNTKSTDWQVFDCLQKAYDWLDQYHDWPKCFLCHEPMKKKLYAVDECQRCKLLKIFWESPRWGEPIRVTYFDPDYILVMWNGDKILLGKSCVTFTLIQVGGERIFDSHVEGDPVLWTSEAMDRNHSVVKSILQNIAIDPSTSDGEYFKNYSARQMRFARKYAQQLSHEGMARFGE